MLLLTFKLSKDQSLELILKMMWWTSLVEITKSLVLPPMTWDNPSSKLLTKLKITEGIQFLTPDSGLLLPETKNILCGLRSKLKIREPTTKTSHLSCQFLKPKTMLNQILELIALVQLRMLVYQPTLQIKTQLDHPVQMWHLISPTS